MEDVLEVYHRPRDPERPVVCLDETSKQMILETREPIAARPGRRARHDYEYARNGVANLFMMFAPLEGWRHGKVTDRHTAIDYAHERSARGIVSWAHPNQCQFRQGGDRHRSVSDRLRGDIQRPAVGRI
jgi:hypothetical protein